MDKMNVTGPANTDPAPSAPQKKRKRRGRKDQRAVTEAVPEEQPGRLRPRHEPPALPVSSSLPERKKSRTAEIQWVKPEYDLPSDSPDQPAKQRIIFPKKGVQFNKKYRLDSADVREKMAEAGFTTDVTFAPSSICGLGAIALRDFKQHELIGIYEGALVKHKPVPESVLKDYCKRTGKDRFDDLEPVPMVTWYQEGDGYRFSTVPDTHTLWSGIVIEDENIELGIDGMLGGNDLKYLNHADTPNVKPVTAFSCEHSRAVGNKLFAQKGKYDKNDLLICIVALDDIPKGAELAFDYGNWLENIDFERVGKDLFADAARYATIKDDHVSFSLDKPSSETSDPADLDMPSISSNETTEKPAFLSTLSDSEKHLVEHWNSGDRSVRKAVIDQLHLGNERMLQLYIYVMKLKPRDIYTGLYYIKDCFPEGQLSSVSAIRKFIRETFPAEEAAPLLGLVAPPEVMDFESTAPAELSETKELFDRIKQNRDDATQAMKVYLYNTVYRSSRTEKPNQARVVYAYPVRAFHKLEGILGKPKHYWDAVAFYKFMLDHSIFKNYEDQVTYMPLKYLDELFNSDDNTSHELGWGLLGSSCVQKLNDGVLLKSIAGALSDMGIRKPDSHESSWHEDDLTALPAVKEWYKQHTVENPKTLVEEWKRTDAHMAKEAMQVKIKQFIGTNNDRWDDIIYEMHKLPMSVKEIYESTRGLSSVGRGCAKEDDVLRIIFARMPEELTLDQQVEKIGTSMKWAYFKLEAFLEKHPGESLEKVFTEEELSKLEKELDEKSSQTPYTRQWTPLLKLGPSKQIHKIFFRIMVQKRTPSKMLGYLKKREIPIVLESAPAPEGALWSHTVLSEVLQGYGLKY